jgi:hypothetical protein
MQDGFAILLGWLLLLAPLCFYAVTTPVERRAWSRRWLGYLALGLAVVAVLDTFEVIAWLLR